MRRDEAGSVGRLALFAGLLAVFYLALDRFAAVDMAIYLGGRDDVLQPERFSILYVGAYGLGLAGWLALHAHASRILRHGSYAITLVTGATFLTFAQINTRGYSIREATLFWEEFEFVPGALAFFVGTWLPPLLLIAAVFGLAEWALGSRMRRLEYRSLVLIPVGASLIFYWMLERSDARLEHFPVPYRVAVLTAYALIHRPADLPVRDGCTSDTAADGRLGRRPWRSRDTPCKPPERPNGASRRRPCGGVPTCS